ncbi:MAG: M48 family metalloprotease [Armatimonadetes bacterium]|nr:M48 family metalloprotease [Armatimonadota bacterium]
MGDPQRSVTMHLVGVAGPVVGRSILLGKAAVTIGRGGDRDVVLSADGTVSRRHATIHVNAGACMVSDDGSTHGTYVNGQRVTAQTLRPGDFVQVGRCRFRLVVEPQAAAAQVPRGVRVTPRSSQTGLRQGNAPQPPAGPTCHICGKGTCRSVCAACSRLVCPGCTRRVGGDVMCIPCADVFNPAINKNPAWMVRAVQGLGPQVARHQPRRVAEQVHQLLGQTNLSVHQLAAEGAVDAAIVLARHVEPLCGSWREPAPTVPPRPNLPGVSSRPPSEEEAKTAMEVVASLDACDTTDPALRREVEVLSQRAGIPVPRVWVSPCEVPNACAVGLVPTSAHIVATQGLLDSMEWPQIRGVLGHEVAHIRLGHSAENTALAARAMGIALGADLIGNLVFAFSDSFLGELLGVGISVVGGAIVLSQLSHSLQQHEFAADAMGGWLAGSCAALAQALDLLERSQRPDAWTSATTAHIAHAFVVPPGVPCSIGDIATHPPTPRRLFALAVLATLSRADHT